MLLPPESLAIPDQATTTLTQGALELTQLTGTGMLVGSPSFMAPEQVRNLDFDERADLFSLGVVLFLLLTGKLPFRSKDLTSLLYQIVHEDPLEPPEIRGELGTRLTALLSKCLAKSATERLQTAGDLAIEARRLRDAIATSELEATVPLGGYSTASGLERSSRRSVRNSGLLTVLAAGVAILAIWWLVDSSNQPPRRVEEQASVAPVAREPAQVQENAGNLVADEAKGTLAQQKTSEVSRSDSDLSSAENSYAENSTTGVPEDDRGKERDVVPPPLELAKVEPVVERTIGEALIDAPVDDVVAPVLAIDELPREVTSSDIVLTGRVMDDRSGVTLSVSGEKVAVDEKGDFRAARQLEPGRNVLTLLAEDAAGNRTLRSLEVTMPIANSPSASVPERAESGVPGIQRPAPRPSRFVDRADGTLIDALSGVMWSKRAKGPVQGWKESKSLCKKLELGRYDDWQLPTIEELEELFLAGAATPAGESSLSFPDGTLWSASKKAASRVWVFDFALARRLERSLDAKEAASPKVLCMRREEEPRRPPQSGLEQPLRRGGGDGDRRPPPPRGGGGSP